MVNRFRVLVVAALAAVFSLATASVAAGSVKTPHSGWLWGNPLPQGKTLYDIAFTGSRGYAVGDFGTVLRTDDGGATWLGLSTGLSSDLRHVRVIAPDSFVAAGGCALRRSDDAGASFQRLPWTASDVRCSSSIAAVFFPSSAIGYLMLDNGNILRTADGGQTWSRRTAVPQTRATKPSSPAQPSDLYFIDEDTGIAAIGAGVVFRTKDGGNTWTLVANPPRAIRGVWFADASNGFAVGDEGRVIKTVNGGETWDGLPLPPTKDDLLSIRCADASTCLVTTRGGHELLRTTDGGATFTSISPATKKLGAAVYASHDRAVAVGESGTTVLSNDAGDTFGPIGGALGGAFRALRASSPSVAYAFGVAGSLTRTTDGGRTWVEMDAATSDDVVDVSFPQASTGFALDAVGQLLRTDNGGKSYEILNTGATRPPDSVVAVDRRRVMLVGPVGIRRSTNGGTSFHAVHQHGITHAGFGEADNLGDFAFAWGTRAAATSTNGGKNWHRMSLPIPVITKKERKAAEKKHKRLRRVPSVERLDFVSTKRAYLLYGDGRLFASRDRGRRWRELPALGTETGYDLDFSDERHGFVSIEEFGDDVGGYLLKTRNGGRTWEPQLVDRENMRVRGLATVSRQTGFALSETNHLFATSTGGSRGRKSSLVLKARSRHLKKPGTLRIDGRLRPADGGEQVVVSVRERHDRRWAFETLPVATNGTFTAFAPLKRNAKIVAQWAGDDTHRGAGTEVLRVRVDPPPKKKGDGKGGSPSAGR